MTDTQYLQMLAKLDELLALQKPPVVDAESGLPPTAEDIWYSNENYRLWLFSLLNDPRWKLAVEVLRDQAMPGWREAGGQEGLVNDSQEFRQLAGFNSFVLRLRLLCLERKAIPGPVPDHSDADVIKWAKESGLYFPPPTPPANPSPLPLDADMSTPQAESQPEP